MSQVPSPGRFVRGINLTPTLEPELADTTIAVKDPPKKARKQVKRAARPATPAEPKAETVKAQPLRAPRIETPAPTQAKKLRPRPQSIAEVSLDLSDLRTNSFCKSMKIDTDQTIKMGIIDAWTSNGYTMFRAVGDTFEAIFKSADTPLMTRMLVYCTRAENDESLSFPTTEAFLTPDEIVDMFADRTLRVST